MSNFVKIATTACLLAGLAACAAGSAESHHAAQSGAITQLALGFWHAIIAPITLICEIIEKVSPGTIPWTVRFYEPTDTGVLYDIGFFVGLTSGPLVLWNGARRRR